jgi:pimeloyl-ACP methyl ester carboxylesterase
LSLLQDRYFESAGVPLRYVEAGQGEPVVLVHSYSSDLEDQWIRTGVLQALTPDYRAIAFDCRGHGRSGKPHDVAGYGKEMALDIVRLLDHLDLDRAHIVGYSLGGHLAAQLLPLHPERFITATLGGACGRRAWSEREARQANIEADEMEEGSLRTQMLRLWPAGKPRPGDEEIAESSRKYLSGKDPRALAAVRRSNGDQVVSAEAIAAAGVPTLGIVGSLDPYLAQFEALKRVMPDLEIVVIDGATHAAASGYPEFAAGLLKFLRAHPRPA